MPIPTKYTVCDPSIAAKDIRVGDWLWQRGLSSPQFSGYRKVIKVKLVGGNVHVSLATGWSTAFHPEEGVSVQRGEPA